MGLLVIVKKTNGSLRLCLDPKDLNKAIKREHYQMPTTESILLKLAGAKLFTKLEASNAYWQIPVDEESSRLLTFNSPYGRYCFKRLPFGIRSASEICQYQIQQILEGLGVANAQDDILVWGETKKMLRKRTLDVLTTIKKNGLKLNKDKCLFEVTELTFLGHKISDTGVEVDPSKTEAICKMVYPDNKKQLQGFLGTINYLGKFIPNITKETEMLRQLLKKDSIWSFGEPHCLAVDNLKGLVCSSPV